MSTVQIRVSSYMRTWTQEEKDYLRENYPVKTKEELENEMDGRTSSAIKNMAYRLGLENDEYKMRARKINNSLDDEAFNNFISGFTAGEGSFIIKNRDDRENPSFEFGIALALEDKEILYKIRDYLDVGNVYEQKTEPKPNQQKMVKYSVSHRAELNEVIVPLFDEYSLQNTKKEKQFEEWKSELKKSLDESR